MTNKDPFAYSTNTREPLKIEITPIQEETLKNCAVLLIKVPNPQAIAPMIDKMKKTFKGYKDIRIVVYDPDVEFTFVQGRDDKTVTEIIDEALDNLKEDQDVD